jgi:hypothetical protein
MTSAIMNPVALPVGPQEDRREKGPGRSGGRDPAARHGRRGLREAVRHGIDQAARGQGDGGDPRRQLPDEPRRWRRGLDPVQQGPGRSAAGRARRRSAAASGRVRSVHAVLTMKRAFLVHEHRSAHARSHRPGLAGPDLPRQIRANWRRGASQGSGCGTGGRSRRVGACRKATRLSHDRMRPGFRNHLFVRAKAGYLLTQSLRRRL